MEWTLTRCTVFLILTSIMSMQNSIYVSPWQNNCLEWCRYPAGALSGVVQVPRRCPVWSGAEIGLMNLLIQRFPGCVIRRLSVCTRVPHREGNSMVGPLFSVGIQTRLEYAGGWRSEEGEITLRMVDSTEFCISMLSRLAESKLRSAKAQRDR